MVGHSSKRALGRRVKTDVCKQEKLRNIWLPGYHWCFCLELRSHGQPRRGSWDPQKYPGCVALQITSWQSPAAAVVIVALGLKSYSKLKWGLWVGSWPSLHWGVHKRPNPSPLGSSEKNYPPPTPTLSTKFVKHTLKWLKTAPRILGIEIYLPYRYCVCIENFKS